MHHKRVGQEKNKLVEEVKQLKGKIDTISPRISELEKQLEINRREKVAAQIERDKALRRVCVKNIIPNSQR